MKRYSALTLVAVVAVMAVLDLTLWLSGSVPLSNQLYRIASGAPAIHVSGKLMQFRGTFPTTPDYLERYRDSDEHVPLFKAKGIPDGMNPPWVFVPGRGGQSFRYSDSKLPWVL